MKRMIFIPSVLLCLFVLWTALVIFVDVKPIGPNGSSVGFAALNGYVRELVGVNITLYTITDWLGLIPIFVAFGFAIFGLYQLVKRKSIFKVDADVLALGVFYIAVMGVFVFFELVPVNFRPVLIDGYLEASYPSSTTLLASTVMPTLAMQIGRRMKSKTAKSFMLSLVFLFTAFMIVGRIVSGVHWFSDIIGGLLVSAFLVLTYRFVTDGKA